VDHESDQYAFNVNAQVNQHIFYDNANKEDFDLEPDWYEDSGQTDEDEDELQEVQRKW
jgi:hypothetical protein